MRALLTPYIQKDLGVVLLKPSAGMMPLFYRRVLITTEPDELIHIPAGIIPDDTQLLAEDSRLQPFFQHERVIAAAGGINGLTHFVAEFNECQCPHSDYHDNNLTTTRLCRGIVRTCWHCDNQFRDQTNPALEKIAYSNLAAFVIHSARLFLMLPTGHQLTLPELCWWSVLRNVSDVLPSLIAHHVTRIPVPKIAGEMKESIIHPLTDPSEIIAERIKPVIKLAVDPEPPAGFMLRPKMQRFVCEKYTRWVKEQNCCGCNKPADDPHHIINHGMGGMGTKVHDLFVIPLCRQCHDSLHRDVSGWERKHGSQLEHLFHCLNRALGIGAIFKA